MFQNEFQNIFVRRNTRKVRLGFASFFKKSRSTSKIRVLNNTLSYEPILYFRLYFYLGCKPDSVRPFRFWLLFSTLSDNIAPSISGRLCLSISTNNIYKSYSGRVTSVRPHRTTWRRRRSLLSFAYQGDSSASSVDIIRIM